MNSRERVLCALAGGTPDRLPFAEQFVAGNIARQLLGLAAEAPFTETALADCIDNDVIKFARHPPLFYDHYEVSEGSGMIGPGRIRNRDCLRELQLPDDDTWISAARNFLESERGERAAVGASRLGISPTLLSIGVENFAVALYDDPDFAHEVFRRYLDFAGRTIQVFCELGFDVLWFFDDFAFKTGPMFSPAVFRDFFLPGLRRLTADLDRPWIFHSDGNLLPVLDDLLSLGMSGLHPLEPEAMSLPTIKSAVAGRACLIGNISVHLLAAGTPEQVTAAVHDAVAVAGPAGYMISSGNCIPHYADIANVRAMVAAIAEHR